MDHTEHPFVTFDLERWQSTWENRVRFNLSESGVHPLSIAELLRLSSGSLEALAALRMIYSQADGTPALRSAIAALYPGATAGQIQVTVGSSEANFLCCWTLIAPGDHVVVVTPTYMQTHGLARNFGATVSTLPLHPEAGWEPDPDEIVRIITPGTRLVVITTPNNPTGHVLSPDACDAIVRRARAAGAWVLADEVYIGAELDGHTTPTLWGSYDRLLCVGGLSKAYGLPGLRIGWIVGPRDFKDAVARRHDYTVIGPTPVSDHLAQLALAARERILERTRGILNTQWPLLEAWLRGFDGLFDWTAPQCGAICLTRYRSSISALDAVEHLRARQDILLVPGDHFGLERHLRLGFGNERTELEQALSVLREGVTEVLTD